MSLQNPGTLAHFFKSAFRFVFSISQQCSHSYLLKALAIVCLLFALAPTSSAQDFPTPDGYDLVRVGRGVKIYRPVGNIELEPGGEGTGVPFFLRGEGRRDSHVVQVIDLEQGTDLTMLTGDLDQDDAFFPCAMEMTKRNIAGFWDVLEDSNRQRGFSVFNGQIFCKDGNCPPAAPPNALALANFYQNDSPAVVQWASKFDCEYGDENPGDSCRIRLNSALENYRVHEHGDYHKLEIWPNGTASIRDYQHLLHPEDFVSNGDNEKNFSDEEPVVGENERCRFHNDLDNSESKHMIVGYRPFTENLHSEDGRTAIGVTGCDLRDRCTKIVTFVGNDSRRFGGNFTYGEVVEILSAFDVDVDNILFLDGGGSSQFLSVDRKAGRLQTQKFGLVYEEFAQNEENGSLEEYLSELGELSRWLPQMFGVLEGPRVAPPNWWCQYVDGLHETIAGDGSPLLDVNCNGISQTDVMTRALFSELVGRFIIPEGLTCSNPFDDVWEDDPFRNEVAAFTALTYSDDEPVLTTPSFLAPPDVDISPLVKFKPHNTINRCEAIKILAEAWDLNGHFLRSNRDQLNALPRINIYVDHQNISDLGDWCEYPLRLALYYEIVNTEGNPNFRPTDLLTYGEAASLIYRTSIIEDLENHSVCRGDFSRRCNEQPRTFNERGCADRIETAFVEAAPEGIDRQPPRAAGGEDDGLIFDESFEYVGIEYGLEPGRVLNPNNGANVPNDGFDVAWENGTDERERDIGTALFCQINRGEVRRESPFGEAEVGRVGNIPPGSRLSCWVRTRLFGHAEVFVDSEVVEWRVNGAYAAMQAEEIILEEAFNGCDRSIDFSARIVNEGNEPGLWEARAFVHPVGADENHPDAVQAERPFAINLAPGQETVVGEFQIPLVDGPLASVEEGLELSVITVDANRGLGVTHRLRFPVQINDQQAPVVDHFDIFGRGDGNLEVVPGEEHSIHFEVTDDQWVARAELAWSVENAGQWNAIAFDVDGDCRNIFAGRARWQIPEQFNPGQRLEVRVQAWDLENRMVEAVQIVRLFPGGEPTVFFFSPLGGEIYEQDLNDGRCAPVEALVVPAPGTPINRARIGWSLGDEQTLQIDGVVEIAPDNTIHHCLRTINAGDGMQVTIELRDTNNVEHHFYAEPVIINPRNDCAPWGPLILEPTQRPKPENGVRPESSVNYSLLSVDDDRFTVLRRDYRRWGDTEELSLEQIFFNAEDYSRIGSVQLLDEYSEERNTQMSLSEIFDYKNDTDLFTSREFSNCNQNVCTWDVISRSIQNGRVTDPIVIVSVDNVASFNRSPLMTNKVKLQNGSYLGIVRLYVNAQDPDGDLSYTKNLYRYDFNGQWRLLRQNIGNLFELSVIGNEVWAFLREEVDENGDGQDDLNRYSAVELNPENGQVIRQQQLMEVPPHVSDFVVGTDTRDGSIYALNYNNQELNYQMAVYREGQWVSYELQSFGNEFRGQPVSSYFVREIKIRDGIVYVFEDLTLEQGNQPMIVRLIPGEPVNLDEQVTDCVNLVNGENLDKVQVDSDGGLLRIENEARARFNFQGGRLIFNQTTVFDSCWQDSFCLNENWNGTVGVCVREEVVCEQDGDMCNGPEICSNEAEACITADDFQVECDDGEDCNGVEACNPATGLCEYTEPPLEEDDGLTCTLDACQNGRVTNARRDGVCEVDLCHAFECNPGDPNADPDTGCVGELLVFEEDGLACTEGIGCDARTGETIQGLRIDACLIDGVCYAEGESSPHDPCLGCNPVNGSERWSRLEPGQGICPINTGGNMEGPEILPGFRDFPACKKKRAAAKNGNWGLLCEPGSSVEIKNLNVEVGEVYDLTLDYRVLDRDLFVYLYYKHQGQWVEIPNVQLSDAAEDFPTWKQFRRIFEIPDNASSKINIAIWSTGESHLDNVLFTHLPDGSSLVPNGKIEEEDFQWLTHRGNVCEPVEDPVFDGNHSLMCGDGPHGAEIQNIVLQQDKLYQYSFDYLVENPKFLSEVGVVRNEDYEMNPSTRFFSAQISQDWRHFERLFRGSSDGLHAVRLYSNGRAFADNISIVRVSDQNSLIQDSNFERISSYGAWSFGEENACHRSFKAAYSDSYGAFCGKGEMLEQTYVPVLPNKHYRFSVAYQSKQKGAEILLGYNSEEGDFVLVKEASVQNANASSSWKWHKASFQTPPKLPGKLGIVLRAQGETYFDKLSLVEQSNLVE